MAPTLRSESARRLGEVRRLLIVAAGLGCTVLAALGAIVPGMPSTIFVIAASYLFARSSPALHRRLLDHRRFGPYVRMAEARAMPRRAKVVSVVSLWAGVALGALLLGPISVAGAAMGVCALLGTAAIVFGVRTASNAEVVALLRP